MLFIHPEGIGKQLTQFANHRLQINKVDVNEQNQQAFDFYQQMGLVVTGREETDGLGRPYPLLLM